jgi:predicted solute-binding protein
VWASRGDPTPYGFWRERVARAVSWAGEHLDEIVAEARRLGAPAAEEDLRTYFSSCIGYRLGAREEKGLERYLSEDELLTSRVYGKVSA